MSALGMKNAAPMAVGNGVDHYSENDFNGCQSNPFAAAVQPREARFRVFPVGPDKAPLERGWQSKATRDPNTIAQWRANGAQAWGIPCGEANGLFVIDLDVDKITGQRVGEFSLQAMDRYSRLISHANVATPSGGRHLYFQHFDGGRNTTSKLGDKIDTRGEGGYVVAPGSVTRFGTYTGFLPHDLPPVPIGIRAKLLQAPPEPVRVMHKMPPTGEVVDLLSHIPADLPYSDWLAVLMGLHARYAGSAEGLRIADQWSATGAKYRPGEVASKWPGFKGSGVTWNTVPAMARQHGANLAEIARRWVWS